MAIFGNKGSNKEGKQDKVILDIRKAVEAVEARKAIKESKENKAGKQSKAMQEFMEKYLNVTPGSVSVMGLMNDTANQVQLLIDRDVAESEFFGCHPCMNTSSLKLSIADLLNKFLPFVEHNPIIVTL